MRDVEAEILHQPPLPLPLQHGSRQTPDAARLLHNLGGDLVSARVQPFERYHFVHKPKLLGRLRIYFVARVEVVGSPLRTHQLLEGQALPVTRDEIETKMRIEQLSVIGTERDIAEQREFRVQARAVDTRDSRDLDIEDERLEQ